jgi:hypothetical protein
VCTESASNDALVGDFEPMGPSLPKSTDTGKATDGYAW